MDAKLDNFSEISKLLSVKSKMSSDILSLFSKFGLGRLLCRLSLEKHDGISAVQLILSLCLFRINGETIHSIYKKNFYHLLTTGKNCYYRMMVRQTMNLNPQKRNVTRMQNEKWLFYAKRKVTKTNTHADK